MKNNILHLTLFLGLTAAIAGGALAYANSVTKPIIELNNEKAEKQTLLEMYPEADLADFTAVTDDDIISEHPDIQKIYQYQDGIVIFQCSVSGYDKGTVFLVAINSADETIDNFKTISNGDTQGIGSRITSEEFRDSVVGKPADGIDTLSGATITSTPVVEAIGECATLAGEVQ